VSLGQFTGSGALKCYQRCGTVLKGKAMSKKYLDFYIIVTNKLQEFLKGSVRLSVGNNIKLCVPV